MVVAINTRRNTFSKWVEKIDKMVVSFYELPKTDKLFRGVRVNININRKRREACWFIGMNILKLKIGRKLAIVRFNEVRKIIFSLNERVGSSSIKRKKIISVLAKICERSPN